MAICLALQRSPLLADTEMTSQARVPTNASTLVKATASDWGKGSTNNRSRLLTFTIGGLSWRSLEAHATNHPTLGLGNKSQPRIETCTFLPDVHGGWNIWPLLSRRDRGGPTLPSQTVTPHAMHAGTIHRGTNVRSCFGLK